MTPTQRAPAGLQRGGATLWRGITADFDLRADERRILEAACREADLIDLIREGMTGAELTARGSMGQPVVNPLIPELRQHRATLASLLRQLRLSDDGGTEQSGVSRSTAAGRALALARWRK